MAATNLDERNLSGAAVGGVVHEDVMDKLWNIDPVRTVCQDSFERGTSENHYKEWVEEQLEAADPDNAAVDGADAGDDESVVGSRLGNYHQISDKVVKVSTRARNVNSIGATDQLARQVMQRQKALRRDVEARLASNSPAVIGDPGGGTPSETAGIGAWIKTNTDRGATTGADPTLSGTTGGYPDAGAIAGDIRALSLGTVKSLTRAASDSGGNPTMAMSGSVVIDLLSDFLFDSTARVATMQTQTGMSNRQGTEAGDGMAGGGVVAQGSVNMLVTNAGTLTLVPNLFQPQSTAGAAGTGGYDMFILDPTLWEVSFLQGYEMADLAKTGTASNRQITVDYALCSMAERGSAVVADIDFSAPAEA